MVELDVVIVVVNCYTFERLGPVELILGVDLLVKADRVEMKVFEVVCNKFLLLDVFNQRRIPDESLSKGHLFEFLPR